MLQGYTNARVQFAEYDTPDFTLRRVWGAPQGANYILAPASSDAQADPDYPGMVFTNMAILYTQGRWQYDYGTDGQLYIMQAGDGGIRHRYPGKCRVLALDAQNSKLCVEPKDGTFWQRSTVAIPDGQSMTLGPYDGDRYLFLGIGSLTLPNGSEIQPTTPFKIAAGQSISISTTGPSLSLLIWK